MKKILLVLAALGVVCTTPTAAFATPQEDLKAFRNYFKKKFPTVKFDDYAKGLYVLPGSEDLREQWKAYNEFPPYELEMTHGKEVWEKKFANGKNMASCFKNKGVGIAQNYPYWDKKTKTIRTLELDINKCLETNGEKALETKGNGGGDLVKVTAHLKALSKGQRVKIDLSDPDAVAAYERGKKYWWTRRGQLNFACYHCHMDIAGKSFGTNQPLSAALGHTVGWPAYRTVWGQLATIHRRYATCNSQVRAKSADFQSTEYRELELYETYLSSGLPLDAPSMRN